MAFKIHGMSYDIKQGTATVSLVEQTPPLFKTVSVNFPFKPIPGGNESENEIERQIRAVAKQTLLGAVEIL